MRNSAEFDAISAAVFLMAGDLILALDAGTSQTAAAVAAGAEILAEEQIGEENGRSDRVAALAAQLLRRVGADWRDLGELIVGSGPGSFTGLRIAYAYVQGLAFSLEIPITTVSSLRAGAVEFAGEARLLAVVADARREEVFAAFYQTAAVELVELQEALILDRSAWTARLGQYQQQVGCADTEIGLVSFLPDFAWRPELRCCQPEHLAVGLIKARGSGRRVSPAIAELAALEPLYLRKVAAKTVAERQGK